MLSFGAYSNKLWFIDCYRFEKNNNFCMKGGSDKKGNPLDEIKRIEQKRE